MRSRGRIVGGVVIAMLVAPALVGAGQSAAGDPSGHWTFTYEPPPSARGRGAGGRGGPSAPGERTVDLWLRLGPGDSVTGSIGVDAGRTGGAPGNNPLRPVEISDGRLDDGRLAFSAWQFDGYTNRVRYEGTLGDDGLDLTMSRETPDGVETIDVQARRVED